MSSKVPPFPTRLSDTQNRSIVDCLGGFVYYEVYRYFNTQTNEEYDCFETGVTIYTTDESCNNINNYVTLTTTYKISDSYGDIYEFFTEIRTNMDIYIRSQIPKITADHAIMMEGFKNIDKTIKDALISNKFLETA